VPTVEETIAKIVDAATWDQRVAQIRLVAQRHGTGEHARIFAEVAREAYVPHLAPDFAYINESTFYERDYFTEVYAEAVDVTSNFIDVAEEALAAAIVAHPRILLVLRTITGLTKSEFGFSTSLVAEPLGLNPISAGKVDGMEKSGTPASETEARVIAVTLTKIMDGTLFGDPPGDKLRRKQVKLDSADGWASVQPIAVNGVTYSDFLHQRHYGGAFRQILDATSGQRGNIIEDAVEALFTEAGIPHVRTGSHNQGDIQARFEISVTPAPDFVVFDDSDSLRAMLECKLVNDGGTARDKALRFERLRAESVRLGGVPLLAVLGGMGWARVNDTLGPVVRDTDGRVFTLATLPQMLEVSPFPALRGLA
jgi:hypothetical protein